MTDQNEMAHRYLLRFHGFEESRNTMENRYTYAVYALADVRETQPEDKELEMYLRRRVDFFREDFLKSQMAENRVRAELFRVLRSIESDDSRAVLWMLYVEHKKEDEIAEDLGISVKKVALLKNRGLGEVEVPEDFCRGVNELERNR